jgi:hypothetical protein
LIGVAIVLLLLIPSGSGPDVPQPPFLAGPPGGASPFAVAQFGTFSAAMVAGRRAGALTATVVPTPGTPDPARTTITTTR